MTLIKQEKLCVHIGYFIHLYLSVFTKLFTGTRVYRDFQFRTPVPEITLGITPNVMMLIT